MKMKPTPIKQALSLLAVGLLSLAAAKAEDYRLHTCYTIPLAGEAASAVMTTNVLDATKGSVVNLQYTFELMGSGTDNVGLMVQASLDGSSWGTHANALKYITVAATGTTPVTLITNIANAYGYGYYRVSYTTNAATATAAHMLTNQVLKFSVE